MPPLLRPLVLVAAAGLLWASFAGCSGPPPATPVATAPPPPPPPAPEPPAKPAPDPYDTAITEIGTILRRYAAVTAGVRDDATADKAVEEIGKLTARLHKLNAEVGKLPHRPDQEAKAIALYTEFSRTLTAQPMTPEVQGNLDLQIKLLTAQQSFLPEFLSIGQALAPRQETAPPAAQETAAPTGVSKP